MRAVQILSIIVCLNVCYSARILGIFHAPSKSHHILGSALLKALARKGHQVTMVSPFPFKTPMDNYTDIPLEEMLTFKEEKWGAVMSPNASTWTLVTKSTEIFYETTNILLSNNNVRKLQNEHFDLVIAFIVFSESILGLAHKLDAPVIAFCPIGSVPLVNRLVGNPAPPSYVTLAFSFITGGLGFWQRTLNAYGTLLFGHLMLMYNDHLQQKLLTKHFPEAPPLQELLQNVSLVFVNSHYSIESPRPYVPNMVQIGGFHIATPKTLPNDLQKYLDAAETGAVLFSLGSNVRMSSLPKDKVRVIVDTLGKLPMRVLFKTDEDVQDMPKNIKISKWLPQNDILAHPNLKLFISHGGLLSTTEAVYHGVPIIGIPIFGDQKQNMAVASASGYAIHLDINTIDDVNFSKAIEEMLHNPMYRDNIKLRSRLLREQPIKPIDNAVFWVEHVLAHKGAAHLRNAGMDLTWYQYILLDVMLFSLASIILMLISSFFCLKVTVKFLKNKLMRKKEKLF